MGIYIRSGALLSNRPFEDMVAGERTERRNRASPLLVEESFQKVMRAEILNVRSLVTKTILPETRLRARVPTELCAADEYRMPPGFKPAFTSLLPGRLKTSAKTNFEKFLDRDPENPEAPKARRMITEIEKIIK